MFTGPDDNPGGVVAETCPAGFKASASARWFPNQTSGCAAYVCVVICTGVGTLMGPLSGAEIIAKSAAVA